MSDLVTDKTFSRKNSCKQARKCALGACRAEQAQAKAEQSRAETERER